MKKKEILPGERFGRLTIIKEVGTIIRKPRLYERRFICKCDCGNEKEVSLYSLTRGYTHSCGCLLSNKMGKSPGKEIEESPRIRLYTLWQGMKKRCSPNSKKYRKMYYVRGISVCDEWRNNFDSFYEWSIANGYSPILSLDRIDNNKGYSPDNCRWATPKQQTNNTSKNVIMTMNGVSHTLAEWSEITGINQFTLHGRKRAGWSDEKALKTTSRKYKTK